MAFEKTVLEQVRKVMNTTESSNWCAEFKYGTLFVECTAREAAKIETRLLKMLNCGIIVSNIDGEFAYDFV
jgi:hypothetical protein